MPPCAAGTCCLKPRTALWTRPSNRNFPKLSAALRTACKGRERMPDTGKVALAPYINDLDQMDLIPWSGQVTATAGLLVESQGPAAAVGDFCEISTGNGRTIRTQVIGFRNG